MSYFKELDEYTESQLREELSARASRRAAGLCDYCKRPPSTPACRFPQRHLKAKSNEPS
jgi:hypothetical protein